VSCSTTSYYWQSDMKHGPPSRRYDKAMFLLKRSQADQSAAMERGNDYTTLFLAWQTTTRASPHSWHGVSSGRGCSSWRLKTLTTFAAHLLNLGRHTAAHVDYFHSPQDSRNKFIDSNLQITRGGGGAEDAGVPRLMWQASEEWPCNSKSGVILLHFRFHCL
jgi:hypothetical protein